MIKDRRTARMRHNQNYNKNVRWLKMIKKEHDISAVNLQPSTDKE